MAIGRLQVRHAGSVEEALALAATPGSRLVAGGTALQLDWAKGLPQPDLLVDLGRISGLAGVRLADGALRIGALTKLNAVGTHPLIAKHLPLLAAAVRTVAGPAVRNLATIGGNVAGRVGCLLPALLALNASVVATSASGQEATRLADWLAQPQPTPSVIEALTLPVPDSPIHWTHRKIGLRAAFTPSVIGVAALLTIDGERIGRVRLAVGGGIVPPARLPNAERLLQGQVLQAVDWPAFHTALLSDIAAPDDPFRTGRYRRIAAANALVHGLGGTLPAVSLFSPAGRRWREAPDEGGRRPPWSGSAFARAPLIASHPLGVSPRWGEEGASREFGRPASSTASGARLVSKASSGGDWHIRPDGPPKIDGTFAYLTDKREPDMLVARILRAGIPHARILSIDTRQAEAFPGVHAVVTHRDIAGENCFGIMLPDQPALCFDTVRYVGDAVAAVAAVDAETANRALGLIRVDYEPLPVVDDPRAALLGESQKIHASGNLQSVQHVSRGDVTQGFEQAAHIVDATYTMARQMHGFMETEGGYAFVADDGMLTVCVGGQHGARDRFQLSRILGMPEEKIRVVTSPTGGAFGGKDELTVQPALALLALKTGRAVRLQLERTESVAAGIKRHPMTVRMHTGCDAKGMLVAQEVDVLADAGAYVSLGPAVLETALEHACGPYIVPNIETAGRLVYTNNGVCGAFRGFGANQMAYAIECQMDRLALACGLSPFEIRSRNLRKPGSPGYLGQNIAPTERLVEMLQAAEVDAVWERDVGLSEDHSDIIGIGMALNYQGNGLGTLPPDSATGVLRLAEDGAIEALSGLDEMGQGLLTAIRAAVSRQLGCSRDDIRPVIGDTARTPDSGSTTASRGTYVVWKVAEMAGPSFTEKLLAAVAQLLTRDIAALTLAPGGIAERGSNSGELVMSFRDLACALAPDDLPAVSVSFDFPKADYTKGNARYIFAFGATLARVAVSRVTGQVRVLDLVQHTAAGPILDAAAYLGQIEGGGLQGLGFTLTEDAVMESGFYLTGNLDTYMMPGIADAPQSIAVHALETLDAGDRYGPRGAGELGIAAVAPAIANAVADALGFWPEQLPIRPDILLDGMAAKR